MALGAAFQELQNIHSRTSVGRPVYGVNPVPRTYLHGSGVLPLRGSSGHQSPYLRVGRSVCYGVNRAIAPRQQVLLWWMSDDRKAFQGSV